MARCLTALLAMVVGAATVGQAEDRFQHGRIRQVEDGVTIQRATETGAEEAVENLPYLPGDRVWTDANGRVEFQFAGGSLLRLDRASKLDYVAHEDGRGERVVLRLWSGGLYLRGQARDGAFEIETPGGVVTADGRGVLRIDAETGETRLSVYEGDARLDDTRVQAGERAFARDGRVEDAQGFDRAEADAFDAWSEEQDSRTAAYEGERRLPEDLAMYAAELEPHGVWYQEPSIGYVWRPRVGINWQPYSQGRWTWTPYGWTWVPGERWGWATSHYGRWGHSDRGGWYWIPSSGWGPAWVSWAVGGDYVGWCPLGYGNRPVLRSHRNFDSRPGRGGHAVPRASANPWTYARRGDLTARDLARRRVDRVDAGAAQTMRVIESPHQARLTRQLAVAAPEAVPAQGGARALPRAVRTRPTMADTVPELRADPMTTIPFPTARRRGEPDEQAREADPASPPSAPDASVRRQPRRIWPSEATAVSGLDESPGESAGESIGGRVRRTAATEASDEDRARRRRGGVQSPEPTPRPSDRVREKVRDRDEEAGRDVLQPVFRPLGRTRTDDGGSANPPRGERSEPRREPSEPRRERPRPPTAEPHAPPPPPPSGDQGDSRGHARRRNRGQ